MKKEILIATVRRAAVVCLFLAMFGVTAFAQDEKFEGSFGVGYTASSGFTIDPVVILGASVNKVGMSSGFAYNLEGDFLFGENASIGFLFARQKSSLSIRGASVFSNNAGEFTVADMSVYNYQFPFTYNFLDADSKVRPFLYVGLGWTQFSPGEVKPGLPALPAGRDLSSNNQFSMSLGGGVKYFVTPKFGFKGTARWTPTYITSQADGYWCNFYYCAVVGDYKYANQGEFTGGVFVRF
jgi:hypothetical protein